MTQDKIKEILERLEKYGQLTPDAIDDLHYIKDYITNLQLKEELLKQEINDVRKAFNGLQQENESLKKRNEFLEKVCVGFDDKYEYIKSINKKAIEYIKQQDMKYYGAVVNTKMDCILTILNGGENNV